MRKYLACLALLTLLPVFHVYGQIVADAVTRRPLPGASVFDGKGRLLGVTDSKGNMPHVVSDRLPVMIRYLGYSERLLDESLPDTVYMSVLPTYLPDVLVEAKKLNVLHILGYVREYSTLSTMTDTVFLFREKMVDFMLTPGKSMRFKGWTKPRVLKSESYYRFTDHTGLDSVSNKCRNHFSWSDWVGIIPAPHMPDKIRDSECGADTLYGKYSPSEIWMRGDSRVNVDVDVLADTAGRKWVPNLGGFFRNNLDFEKFRLKLDYRNVIGNEITERDLAGYSFVIESNGRGRDMFMFNRKDEKFSVSTYAEVYVVDREMISVKEARKWKDMKFDTGALAIIEPPEAPALQPYIRELIARVDGIDHDGVRLDFTPDERLAGGPPVYENIGRRVLNVLKTAVGISQYKSKRNFERRWKEFTEQRRYKNNMVYLSSEQSFDSGQQPAQGKTPESEKVDSCREREPEVPAPQSLGDK